MFKLRITSDSQMLDFYKSSFGGLDMLLSGGAAISKFRALDSIQSPKKHKTRQNQDELTLSLSDSHGVAISKLSVDSIYLDGL